MRPRLVPRRSWGSGGDQRFRNLKLRTFVGLARHSPYLPLVMILVNPPTAPQGPPATESVAEATATTLRTCERWTWADSVVSDLILRSLRSFLRGARGGPGYKQQAQGWREYRNGIHRVVNLTHSLTSRGKFVFVNYDASYIYLFSVDLLEFDICSRSTPKKTNRCGDDRLHPLSFCL